MEETHLYGGGVYNDCSDADGTAAWLGTLHFDFTSSGVSPTTSTSTTCGNCTRPITVTGTAMGGTTSTEAVQGNQNMDGDTVDDLFRGGYSLHDFSKHWITHCGGNNLDSN